MDTAAPAGQWREVFEKGRRKMEETACYTKAREIVADMTLEEKAQVLVGATTYGTKSFERFGIPSSLLQDGGSGVNLRQYLSNLLGTGKLKNEKLVNRYGGVNARGVNSELVYIMDHITKRDELDQVENELVEDYMDYIENMISSRELPNCMPCNSLLAATWDTEAVLECGRVVGREACVYGIDSLLGTPCINIQRDPLAGRGFECYSEDPYLVSKLSPYHCIGVQEAGVVANVKHLAANNQESNRKTINEMISERALREIYFPGFKACVQKGGAKSIMTGYNWINGEACAHNRWMIEDVLRKEWGFEGCVVSDWGGVYDQIAAIKAGNDLTMPRGDSDEIVKAVKSGELTEEQVTVSAERVVRMLLDMPAVRGRKYTELDNEMARKAAYYAASEGIVLLKNEKTLPFSVNMNIAFYGERCRQFEDSGVGSGRVHTDKTSHMTKRAEEIAGCGHILYDEVQADTDAVVVTVFAPGQEGSDRTSFDLDAEQITLVKRAYTAAQSVGAKLVVILNVAAPINLMEIEPLADAILCIYFPGEEGGNATADILYGVINPSGKLPHTFPKHYCDTPSFGNFPGENKTVYYGEGILVGYRWYDTRHIEPLYPFGYGLSYTEFAIPDVKLSTKEYLADQENLKVMVTVQNIGGRPGREVVQLYVQDEVSSLFKPEKELKGFVSVYLQPGESKEVEIELTKDDFSSFDPELRQWTCEPGKFKLLIGNSSRNILQETSIILKCENPYAYGPATDYRTLIEDERSLDLIASFMPEGTITKNDLTRQMVYYAQTMDFRQAYPQYISLHFKNMTEDEKWELFDKICKELKKIDVMGYAETETY